ncbi:MAG: cytidylate kinase-like family protein [Lachnospiraceae bacterium]|nr:cytidylate kinase-like family protein [Lachnospiraceae bacterium]
MKIITLSREYGAGGHSIGTEVAKRLNIEFYDKDIIAGVAKESGIDENLIAAKGEEISVAESIIRAITPISYDQKDLIFETEKNVIIDIAKKGPCVILGRCADIILKEAGLECLNVFLYADTNSRMKRVGELINSDNEALIQKVIKKTDHDRHSYYTYFTYQKWGDYKNYNLMLDTGALGYEKCIDMICEAAR